MSLVVLACWIALPCVVALVTARVERRQGQGKCDIVQSRERRGN